MAADSRPGELQHAAPVVRAGASHRGTKLGTGDADGGDKPIDGTVAEGSEAQGRQLAAYDRDLVVLGGYVCTLTLLAGAGHGRLFVDLGAVGGVLSDAKLPVSLEALALTIGYIAVLIVARYIWGRYAAPDAGVREELNRIIDRLEAENERLRKRNDELRDLLNGRKTGMVKKGEGTPGEGTPN
jgi:hypothetical protein